MLLLRAQSIKTQKREVKMASSFGGFHGSNETKDVWVLVLISTTIKV